ncbi:hypothetical protein R6Q59_008223 [Mikania micrantha]
MQKSEQMLATLNANMQAFFSKLNGNSMHNSNGEGEISGGTDVSFRGERLHRIREINFPKFDGSDVDDCIYCCEHFFSADETPENFKSSITGLRRRLEVDVRRWRPAEEEGRSEEEFSWSCGGASIAILCLPGMKKINDSMLSAFSKKTLDVNSSVDGACNVTSSDLLILEGHSAKVHACAWSPAGLLLASGSGDSTARIWRIADRTNSSSLTNSLAGVCVLKHFKAKPEEKSKDINTLDWNVDGTLLATGSHDGFARVWNTEGRTYAFCCFSNVSRIIMLMLNWTFIYPDPALDVDWGPNHNFATGSSYAKIYVCKIGENQPLKMFSGHKHRVNCVKWDARCLLLASCSNDMTAKKINTISWSHTGPATENSNKKLLLARDALYSLAFSPNSEYLASGSGDNVLNIWSVKECKIIKAYPCNGGISQVSWNKEGNKIAYSSHDKSVCVSDFRM